VWGLPYADDDDDDDDDGADDDLVRPRRATRIEQRRPQSC